MNQQPSWVSVLMLSFAVSGLGFAQSDKKQTAYTLKSVKWPGLGTTTAVCVKQDGLWVCVLPEGDIAGDEGPRIFDENGEEQATKLLHRDQSNGICLLETEPVKKQNPHLPLSTRSIFEPGLALTSLLPSARLRTRLAGKDREYLGKELPAPMLRVRTAPNANFVPGTPIINAAGELEGVIANRKLSNPNEAHAIPAGVIRKVIADVENHQKSAPVWVGMIFHSESSTAQVVEVKEASPALAAGMQANDIILAVNGHRIGELSDLVEALKLLPGESPSSFKVLRDLDELELQVVPKFIE